MTAVPAPLSRFGGLAPWSLFAALIAAAGLPIYIHAPKFYVDEYGVSLAALGGVLFALRLIDVVQDPLLGWIADVGRRQRRGMVASAAILMAMAMLALFAVPPPIAPLAWFALTLGVMFTAFSFLTIAFYAEGVSKAETLGPGGHVRLAGWRETGGLIGISLASVAPVALAGLTLHPFAAFAVGFAALAVIAVLAMRQEWEGVVAPRSDFRIALRDAMTRRLLLLALVNSAPVAVTSTLFLFFVESRLQAPGWEGPLLLLFFLAAAVSAPLWSRAAARFGARRTLMAGMILAIVTFGFATLLGSGDTMAFALICVASGAALGGDMTLLPAIFARHLAQSTPEAGPATAFGLWSFVSKLSLALAAATLLPLLQAQGFTPGTGNSAVALTTLSLLYAALPCALKLLAIALLALTPVPEA